MPGYLKGLNEYLEKHYRKSIFDEILKAKDPWDFYLHGHKVLRGTVAENLVYDAKIDVEGKGVEVIPKVQIKMLHKAEFKDAFQSLLKTNKNVKAEQHEFILSPSKRYHIKNKSLYPLMVEREVLFFTLLEGEVIRGIIDNFTQYEITVNLKGGIPVTILRHAVYDVRNKKGRSFLKSVQKKAKEWEKSDLYVEGEEPKESQPKAEK